LVGGAVGFGVYGCFGVYAGGVYGCCGGGVYGAGGLDELAGGVIIGRTFFVSTSEIRSSLPCEVARVFAHQATTVAINASAAGPPVNSGFTDRNTNVPNHNTTAPPVINVGVGISFTFTTFSP
jgi:hypothetical protein